MGVTPVIHMAAMCYARLGLRQVKKLMSELPVQQIRLERRELHHIDDLVLRLLWNLSVRRGIFAVECAQQVDRREAIEQRWERRRPIGCRAIVQDTMADIFLKRIAMFAQKALGNSDRKRSHLRLLPRTSCHDLGTSPCDGESPPPSRQGHGRRCRRSPRHWST